MTAVQRGEGRVELRVLNVTLISDGNETNIVRTTVFKRIISTLRYVFTRGFLSEIPIVPFLSYFPNLLLY